MLNLNSLMVGTSQPEVMSEFYTKIFAKPADMVDGDWHGWQVGKAFFSVGKHSEIHGNSKEPQRLIFNLETKEVKAEFNRMKSLGAQVIKEPYEMESMMIATLADPDGNYFQLMTPWEVGE